MNDKTPDSMAADSHARSRNIMRARARVLARPQQRDARLDASIELLEFGLALEAYAVETRHVLEVHRLRDLTPVPCTPPYILGLVNLRGSLTPVLDIKKFFGLPEKGVTDLHRVILVRADDFEFGVLADVVTGVSNIPSGSLRPPLPTFSEIAGKYVRGVTGDSTVVLDLPRIWSDPRLVVHEEVAS